MATKAKEKAKPRSIRKHRLTSVGEIPLPTMGELAALRSLLSSQLDKRLPEEQDVVAQRATEVCLQILGEWPKRCTCPTGNLTRKQKDERFSKFNGAKLCQACKRLKNVLYVWQKLEELAVRRQKHELSLMQEAVAQNGRQKVATIQAEARRAPKVVEAHPSKHTVDVIREFNESGQAARPRVSNVS